VVSSGTSLPGTLWIPKSGNKKILAIFIHGSGPNDRDETLGPNAPFLDIASDLLKYGISSYRFDKKTKVAPELFEGDFTVDDEVTDDIVHIVDHFHENDSFKSYSLVLIGHSLGGMMLPRIATLVNGKIDAAVIMAGNARPLQDVALEQFKYLNTVYPGSPFTEKIRETEAAIEYLNSPEFSKDSPNDKLPLGWSATYWMSLSEYDQRRVAERLTLPLLLLQGERDYQVTMTDFKLWKEQLGDNPNCKLIAYPKLNHLFLEGSGKSTPLEYKTAGDVPGYVTQDIAEWLSSKIY